MKLKLINCKPIGFTPSSSHARSTRESERGFTLLEVLTAMFILALVVTVVLSSYDSIFSSAEHINISSDLMEMGNACIGRITADLEAIHVMSYPRYKQADIDDDQEIYHLLGEEKMLGGSTFTMLRFASLAHLPLNQDNRQGISEIVYYVQSTDSGEFTLRRTDKLYPYPEKFEESPTDPVMCEQVRAFELVYYDHEGQEYKEWDSESDDAEYSTPRSIAIKLALGNEEVPVVFTTEVALPLYRVKPEES